MSTPYDWITTCLFAALVVVFMDRSMRAGPARDRLWHYAPPACGCAVINQIGNAGLASQSLGLQALAVLGVAGVLVNGYRVLQVRP